MAEDTHHDEHHLSQLARLLDDRPVAENDQLRPRLAALAEQLAELLPHLAPSSPLMLSGDWGAGKTSLLRALERKLLESGNLATVWFEAWRYEGEDALLPALIRRVWESAPESFRRAEERAGLLDGVLALAAALSARAAPLLLSAAGVAGVPLAGAAGKVLDKLTLDKVKKELGAVEGEDEEPPANPTDLLWDLFHGLLAEAFEQQSVVIFIDDLDRCSPQNTLDLLEAVRMLLVPPRPGHEPRCRFVLALDRGIVAEAVAKKFSDLGSYEGHRYLEKIFPVSFDLPTPDASEVSFLIERFLAHFPTADDDEGRWADRRDALRRTLADPVFAVPRSMKQTIHRFGLVAWLEERDGSGENGDPAARAARDHALARWIAAIERWPKLRRLFAREDDAYWRRLREALEDGEARGRLDDDGAELLTQPSLRGWLEKELLSDERQLAVFRQADERLRRWGL